LEEKTFTKILIRKCRKGEGLGYLARNSREEKIPTLAT